MVNIGYYEGILQLRNPNKEIISIIKKNKDIVYEEKVVNGIDYYFKSQKQLQSFSRKLQKHFAGELKISRKLHTVNRITMKRVYRITILFRLPGFKKGNIIEYKGKKIRIKMLGKKAHAVEIDTGKKISFSYSEI